MRLEALNITNPDDIKEPKFKGVMYTGEGYVLEFDVMEIARDLSIVKNISVGEALLIILINEIVKLNLNIHHHLERIDDALYREEKAT